MTIRSLTLVALVMVMGSSSGCCGMKNFMFGRGARCGLCNRARAIGTAINPLAAAPAPAPTAAAAPGCRLPGCGLFGRNQAPNYAPTYAPPTAYAPAPACAPNYAPNYGNCQGGYAAPGYAAPNYAHDGCASEGYSSAMPSDCGCGVSCGGNCGSSYQGGVMYDGSGVDPYLGSGAVNGGYQGGGSMQGDGFQPRNYRANRYDEQGDRIISEDPMPSGIEYLN